MNTYVMRFRHRFHGIYGRFQDFTEDFGISREISLKISRFHGDFKISRKISRFQERFHSKCTRFQRRGPVNDVLHPVAILSGKNE